MHGLAALSAGVITSLRAEWFRVRLDRTHLRLFCGRLIVMTLEGRHAWLALSEELLDATSPLKSWSWDERGLRPSDAAGQPYPRYARPPSRNGFYSPDLDPSGVEWTALQTPHLDYLKRVVVEGRAPDHRTRSTDGLTEAVLSWGAGSPSECLSQASVVASLRSSPAVRRARMELAPRKPASRMILTRAFDRSPDVIAEALLRAAGICESCREPAPFARASDGTPYLEVHHRTRLSDGGDDSIDNVLAVCPNCHRRWHFGRGLDC